MPPDTKKVATRRRVRQAQPNMALLRAQSSPFQGSPKLGAVDPREPSARERTWGSSADGLRSTGRSKPANE